MIKKNLLLSQIKILLENEKLLSPLLNKHVSSALFFSGLGAKEREDIKERFQAIVINSKKSVQSLVKIKDEIEKGNSNVY